MERIEQTPEEKAFPENVFDDELEMLGAGFYRASEVDYYTNLKSYHAIREYLENAYQGPFMHPILLEYQTTINILFREMERYREDYDLIIGGENGQFFTGQMHTFDPELHLFEEEPEREPPQKSEPIMVTMSEIGKKIDGKIEQILPPAFSRPEEAEEHIMYKNVNSTLPSSDDIFTR